MLAEEDRAMVIGNMQKKMVKIGNVVLDRPGKQTKIHAYRQTLIIILCHPTGSGVINNYK